VQVVFSFAESRIYGHSTLPLLLVSIKNVLMISIIIILLINILLLFWFVAFPDHSSMSTPIFLCQRATAVDTLSENLSISEIYFSSILLALIESGLRANSW